MNSVVSIVRTEGYNALRSRVCELIDNLGGWENFVRSGDSVLLKVNLLSARQPARGVTTHPEVVRAVAESLLDFGAKVALGDSPGGADKGLERVFRNTGMIAVAEELGIPWIKFETAGTRQVRIDDRLTLFLTEATSDYDHVINMPKLKTHSLTLFTGAVKNLFGLVPGLRKATYHKLFPLPSDFARMLVAVYEQSPVTLHIMDGVVGMEGNGPSSGDLRDSNLLLASTDGVALDAVACHLIGIKEGRVKTTLFADKKGLGNGKLANIDIAGGNIEDFVLEQPFKLPPMMPEAVIPSWILRFFARFIKYRPIPLDEKCIRCGVCAKHCPVDAIQMHGKELPDFDYSKCITCLCCMELCPEEAVKLDLNWIAKRIA
jgi:uncharacterized protein (DUF362 family)/Pyruvate/2-oxoacid:ferredoxin oxidoreductase delta subunit